MRPGTTETRRALPIGVIALVLLGGSGAPRADDGGRLARARAAKQRVDYEAALVEVERALQAGGLSVEDSREALLLRGEFLAVLGRAAEATETFVELLAVAPGTAIDPGLAPRVVDAFEAASRQAVRPVVVSCRVSRRGTLAVALEAGSSARVRFVRVERREKGATRRVSDQVTPPTEMMLARRALEVACFAVDAHGNALVGGPGWERPLVAASAATLHTPRAIAAATVAADVERPSFWSWRSPWPWAGAALAVGAGGATFHWLASRDQARLDELIDESSTHYYPDASQVLERGERRMRWARGLYIGAGALAAVAVTMALLPARRPRTRSAVRLSVGLAGVALTGEL